MIDVPTFKSWLAKGLGRPAVFLKEHDATPYLNALLDACTHNLTYDAQCEDERTPYLWQLIQFSKHPAFFRNQVLQHLTEKLDNPDEYRWTQLFGLARLFAAQDDAQIRQAMYSAFKHLGFENAGASAQVFIELDGLDGFVFAASCFKITNPDNELWEISALIRDLEERLGKEQIPELLAEAARQNKSLATVLEAVQQYERRSEEESISYKSRATLDYLELKARKADGSWASELRRWAATATSEQINVAGDDLISETDAEKLWGYLRIFNRKAFPRNPNRLLALANDEHKRIKRTAVVALSNVSHPDVRSHALALLQSTDRFADGARMLVSNYEPGDFYILEDLLRRPMTEHECHDLGFSIKYILERHLTPDAEASLLLLYENNPCSNCRESFVRFLTNLNIMPEWMRLECRYDANADTIHAVL